MIIVKTTLPTLELALKLKDILLNENLASCINIQESKSFYKWESQIQSNNEIELNIKTNIELYHDVESTIINNHPYKIPQIIAIKVHKSNENYEKWHINSIKNKFD